VIHSESRWRSALPAYVSIRQHTSACSPLSLDTPLEDTSAYVSIRQHMSQHTSAYVCSA
jgi:hypothetical protein